MQKSLLVNLENLLDANADSFELLLALLRSEVVADVDVEHFSAVAVARDVLKISAVRDIDAKVILMALAYPAENQAVIATLCGVSVRTVKRVFARWKGVPWVGNLADLRAAIAPRGGRSAGTSDG